MNNLYWRIAMGVDFAAVQWSRRALEALRPLQNLTAEDLRRLLPLIQGMTELPEEAALTDEQLGVILQNMFAKRLVRIQADKGGILVEFSGGGFEYERFLIRSDGRVPNSRYEAKRAEGDI
jgi:hypothetical protein